MDEVTDSKVMFVLSFTILLLKCIMKRQGRSALGYMVGTILECLLESMSPFGAVPYWKMTELFFQCKSGI